MTILMAFASPLDENMRLKLILQRRMTEVRALQELRYHQERRKLHIIDLQSRLKSSKDDCKDAVNRVAEQAVAFAREETMLNTDAKGSAERMSIIATSAREMEAETQTLKEGLVQIGAERRTVETQTQEKLSELKAVLTMVTQEATESAVDFDLCHRLCTQESTRVKNLMKQCEVLTHLGVAWEKSLLQICDIDASDAISPVNSDFGSNPNVEDSVSLADASVESLTPRMRDISSAGASALLRANDKLDRILAYAKVWNDRTERVRQKRDSYEFELVTLKDDKLTCFLRTAEVIGTLARAEKINEIIELTPIPLHSINNNNKSEVGLVEITATIGRDIQDLYGKLEATDDVDAISQRRYGVISDSQKKISSFKLNLVDCKSNRQIKNDEPKKLKETTKDAALKADLKSTREDLKKRKPEPKKVRDEDTTPQTDYIIAPHVKARTSQTKAPKHKPIGITKVEPNQRPRSPPKQDQQSQQQQDGAERKTSLVNIAFAKRSTTVMTGVKGLFGRKSKSQINRKNNAKR